MSPTINHPALVRVLAIALADHTTWDSPPCLYTIHNHRRPQLKTDLNATVDGMDIHVTDLLTALADACYQTHRQHPEQPLVATGFTGVALRAEAWGLGIDTDHPTPVEPYEGLVRHHPDRVETASVFAVTTDDMFHTLHWIRGAPQPRIESTNLTNSSRTGRWIDGRLVRTLRRLMRIIRHHQQP